jgi:hypothetical protein
MKELRFTFGLSLVLFALVLGGVALFAIFDPAGSKLADDNDPFGPPPSRVVSVVMLGTSVAINIVGMLLIVRSTSKHSDRC